MNEDIPTSNDLIVIGTGLVESIVAAAASRIGKQVVHLDYRDYYGSSWTTFTFNNIPRPPDSSLINLQDKDNEEKIEGDFPIQIVLSSTSNCIQNVTEKWSVPDGKDTSCDEANATYQDKTLQTSWSKKEIEQNFRKFNFDLAPKILYSRGDMVEVLISSGICRYAEFKNVSFIYLYDPSEKRLVPVPCSRADVFNSKEITMVEKRLLMKTVSICSDYTKDPINFPELATKKFADFLSENKINGKIRNYLMNTVANASETTDFGTAVQSVDKFVRSIGRYGNTPFLWTLYGSGELPQCFCRCSAVFGGIYCLKRSTQSIVMGSDARAVGVRTENQSLNSSFIVVEDSLIPKATIKSCVSRAILITDKSLIPGNDQVTLINYPPINGMEPVRILELSPSSMACPRGLYVVHFITRHKISPAEDLKSVIETLYRGGDEPEQENEVSRPNILWSLHFSMNEYEVGSGILPPNVFSSPGPNASMDFDEYVIEAKRIFTAIFPNEEFLPKVPDPDDLVLEDVSPPEPEPSPQEDQEPENANELPKD